MRIFAIARCSLGHWGVVTDVKKLSYPDGETAWAFTGWHLLPLRLFGRPWSSRNPTAWLIKP